MAGFGVGILVPGMTAFALLFTLAAVGVSETVYLIRKRIAAEKPICPIGGGCAQVLTSKYNKIFIVPNDTLGLLAYIVIATIAALLVIGVEPTSLWDIFLKILVAAAALVSLLLTYLQWQVIRAWCFWCLMSAFTIWLMGFIIIASLAV
ncbi:hypothetical protein EPN90_04405 [Patescibacteria group bacterium]|nr:MAG: hypothetical protein EPN90_04405 [Patescibacteria group bacterium]